MAIREEVQDPILWQRLEYPATSVLGRHCKNPAFLATKR